MIDKLMVHLKESKNNLAEDETGIGFNEEHDLNVYEKDNLYLIELLHLSGKRLYQSECIANEESLKLEMQKILNNGYVFERIR